MDWIRDRFKKILVVRNDNIGDVICTTPALQALREAFPGAYIAILVAEYSQDAILGNPHVDEIFVYGKYKHGRSGNRLQAWTKMGKLFRKIRRHRFDLAIGMRSKFTRSLGWLVYLSGARFRLGFRAQKGEFFKFFFNLYAEPAHYPEHEVNRCFRLLRHIGIDSSLKGLTLCLFPEEEDKALHSLQARGLSPGRPLIAIHPEARREANRWPVERFAQVGDFLMERYGAQVLLVGPPGEQINHEVAGLMSKGPVLFPTASIRELAALIKHCSLFICSDGGSMHVAAAVGTPIIALFGDTDPREWAPWGDGHIVLKRGRKVEEIQVEEVCAAIQQVL